MTRARRRLLFVSYWVPPRRAIGTVRSTHILRHLPELNWDVHVVTARFQAGRNGIHSGYTQTNCYDLKGSLKRLAGMVTCSAPAHPVDARYERNVRASGRAHRLLADFVTYPDDYVGWLPFAVPATRRLLARGEYDALLTSSPPVTANLIAAAARGNVPWIADLRDLWAENDSNERSFLQNAFDDKLERAVLSRAAALTATSDLSADRFRKRYPGTPCFAIATGFDAEEWKTIAFGRETPCVLMYAGSLYHGKRDPRVLFQALANILERGLAAREDLRVDFYSEAETWLTEMIERFRLGDVVCIRGLIDRRTVLAAERRADRLLVFSWDGPTAEGIVPGKVFEYFGARRPILAIGGTRRSAVHDMLTQTGAGVRCLTVEEVQAQILEALTEHPEPRIVPEDAVSSYSGLRCASLFAEVLDSVARL